MTDKKHDRDQERTEASPPRNEGHVRAEQQPAREGPLDPRWPPDDPRQSMSNPHIPAAPQRNAVAQVEESPGHMPSINEPPGSNVAPSSPPDDGHEKSPQVTDVSRETEREPETDRGNKRHR